jgi:hypothetical protein
VTCLQNSDPSTKKIARPRAGHFLVEAAGVETKIGGFLKLLMARDF